MPGAPRTALIAYAATASASLSLALVERPDNGGTMPSEKSVFTARVEPVSPPCARRSAGWMVEAPGTAPGSTTLIPRTVYRHSRRTSPANIGSAAMRGKGAQDPSHGARGTPGHVRESVDRSGPAAHVRPTCRKGVSHDRVSPARTAGPASQPSSGIAARGCAASAAVDCEGGRSKALCVPSDATSRSVGTCLRDAGNAGAAR